MLCTLHALEQYTIVLSRKTSLSQLIHLHGADLELVGLAEGSNAGASSKPDHLPRISPYSPILHTPVGHLPSTAWARYSSRKKRSEVLMETVGDCPRAHREVSAMTLAV
jgi:hypothetical protein